jgi:hypothetical protein
MGCCSSKESGDEATTTVSHIRSLMYLPIWLLRAVISLDFDLATKLYQL